MRPSAAPLLATALAVALWLSACSSAKPREPSRPQPAPAPPAIPPPATESRQPSGGPTGATPTRAIDQPAPVDTLTLTLVDATRATPENGPVPGKPSRTLATAVWYPVDGRRLPLVVFCHGIGSDARFYAQPLELLAAAGYVVAAPTFPLSSSGAPGGANLFDVVNQPADVRFVIDQLLGLAADPASPLHDRIDGEHVGVAGHSLGGFTALALAFNTCCRDPRVKAAVVVAGGELPLPNGTFSAGTGTPVLFVHGDHDSAVPYRLGRAAYDHRAPPKLFLTLVDGDHVPFDQPGQGKALLEVVQAFFRAELTRQPADLHALLRGGFSPGVARLESLGV